MSARLTAAEITDEQLAALYERAERAEATATAVGELVDHLGGPWRGRFLDVLGAPDPVEAVRALRGGWLPPGREPGRAA
jgi:hypothetical protein